ncbi:MAG: DUF3373 family protein [Campylobacterota bacterium]|nr:DUF3373 family protein [Campylobacterota bacterium]
MIKKIILSSVAATLLATTSNALTLEEKVNELEQQVNELTKIKIKNSNDFSEEIEDLDERLGTVETRSFTDKIQLGLGMRVEANNFETTYADGSKPANEDIVYRTKLNINMKAKIADNLKFTGRLSSYKNWGDSNTDVNAYSNIDSRQGRTPDNTSSMFAERAYLDWIFNGGDIIPVTMTLGRQPSSDGPSYQIKEGMSRKGTYDALAFDGAADGVVLTANLNKVLEGTSARIAYGVPSNTSDNGSATSTVKDTKVIGIFADKEFEGIGNTNLFQIYHVMAKDFNADSSGQAGANDINVGDFDLSGLMFEVSNMNNFDFFAHYAKSTAKPNGNSIDMGRGLTTGLLTSTANDIEEKSGNATWIGLRYNATKTWSLGAEWNKGSKNWFSFTYSPNDPINKLATRGTATEVYVSKKINKNSNIRLGMVNIDYDYTGSGMHLGTPMEMSSMFGTAVVKEKTNTYITFNVLF